MQAVYKYVTKSGNKSYLQNELFGLKVIDRLEAAMNFLLNEKMAKEYGLITGATTADWGDVQPEHFWGVAIDENTHYTIDIYDNAMFVIALNNLIEMCDNAEKKANWTSVRDELKQNIKKHLWDAENQKLTRMHAKNTLLFLVYYEALQLYRKLRYGKKA